jgi:hypothetical protein
MCSAIFGENSSLFYVCVAWETTYPPPFIVCSTFHKNHSNDALVAMSMMLRNKVLLEAEILKKKETKKH